jgi:transposase
MFSSPEKVTLRFIRDLRRKFLWKSRATVEDGLHDWVPEEDLSWFVVDVVEQMDLSAFYARYRTDGVGGKGYEPSMMVALLLYAYCLGERSSRKIEWFCQRDVGFKVVAANQVPDHTAICRFRQEHEEALKGLFTSGLELCKRAGLVKVGVVALDGTKIQANASLEANRTKKSIEAEVERMFAEAEERDRAEDSLYGEKRGDELPEGLSNRKERMDRLRACKTRLDEEEAAAKAEQERKAAERAEKEAKAGKKLRGRKPKEPKDNPEDEPKANVTDPDSRIMKTRRGHVQGYNAQAVVTKGQIIVAAEVTQDCNDVRQLNPMLKKAQENLNAVGVEEKIETGLADAGYWSEKNIKSADPAGPDLLVATKKDWKQRKEMADAPSPRGRIPEDLSPRERMERKLRTRRGRTLYKMRGCTVEPTFGQIKSAQGFERFSRRGRSACDSEFKLEACSHNLLKLYRSGRTGWKTKKRGYGDGVSRKEVGRTGAKKAA